MLDCIHIEYISLLVESFSYSSFNLACIQWSFLEKASLHLYPTFSQFGCVKIQASAIFLSGCAYEQICLNSHSEHIKAFIGFEFFSSFCIQLEVCQLEIRQIAKPN